MGRVRSVALLAVCAVLAAAASAVAIQYGGPDNGAHPYVGGLVYDLDGTQVVGCSGTMIGPTTFLTAAHCAPDPTFHLLGVTFDSGFVPGTSTVHPVTSFIQNPAYDGSIGTDAAVVILQSNPGVGVATLPTAGALNSFRPSSAPGRQPRSLTAVGYGSTGLDRGTGAGKPAFVFPDVRMRAETRVIGLFAGAVQTTAAPGTGGGTCFGDSGGPFFAGAKTIVAITNSGTNKNCGGADLDARIDTPAILAFLHDHV
jgi:hypothetical protein